MIPLSFPMAFRTVILQRDAFISLTLVVAHQLIIASSAYFLIEVITRHQSGKEFTQSLLFYFIAMALPYVPGCISLIFLQRWINSSHKKFIDLSICALKFQTRLYAKKEIGNWAGSVLSRNSFSSLKDYIEFAHNSLSMLLNSLLSIIVMAFLLPGNVFTGYLASMAACSLIIICTRGSIRLLAEKQESSQILFSATLHKGWANLTIGNSKNIESWLVLKENQGRSFYKNSDKSQVVKQLANMSLACATLAPTIYLVSISIRENFSSPQLIAAILINLTRIFLILNALSSVVYRLLDFTSVHARLIILFDAINFEIPVTGVAPRPNSVTLNEIPINSADDILKITQKNKHGRHLLAGKNGSGKSTILYELKHKLKERCGLLPASEQDLIWNDDIQQLSTGNKAMASLDMLTRDNCPEYVLLDEWDANLDTKNTSIANDLIGLIAEKSIVIEVRH